MRDRLTLRDYLILPVQRITKYNLLLKNFMKYSIKAGIAVPNFHVGCAMKAMNLLVYGSYIEPLPLSVCSRRWR